MILTVENIVCTSQAKRMIVPKESPGRMVKTIFFATQIAFPIFVIVTHNYSSYY